MFINAATIFVQDNIYLFFKVIHIISFTSWMAGLLYLPRLFVYHADSIAKSPHNREMQDTFLIMEKRLLRYIMFPAMAVTILSGIMLLSAFPWQQMRWIHIKFVCVIALVILHHYFLYCHKNFRLNKNKHSSRFFRMINEIPIVIMICIVFLVIFKI